MRWKNYMLLALPAPPRIGSRHEMASCPALMRKELFCGITQEKDIEVQSGFPAYALEAETAGDLDLPALP